MVAAEHLVRRGYRILARNWRWGRWELDIVARSGPTVVFVEVKTRRPGLQPPAEAVSPAKRRRLVHAARAWIHGHPGHGSEFRFDVVTVLEGGPHPIVRHIADAFHADGT